MIEYSAAGEHEFPGFLAISGIAGPLEAGFIVGNYSAQSVINCDGIGRRGVVEVEDGYAGVGLLDFLASIADVLGGQVPMRQILFRGAERCLLYTSPSPR